MRVPKGVCASKREVSGVRVQEGVVGVCAPKKGKRGREECASKKGWGGGGR